MKTYTCSSCGLTNADLADLVDPDLFFGVVDGLMLCNTCLKPTAPLEDLHPCHITAWHGPHDWTPMVPDPVQDGVFHIGLATLRCGGRR